MAGSMGSCLPSHYQILSLWAVMALIPQRHSQEADTLLGGGRVGLCPAQDGAQIPVPKLLGVNRIFQTLSLSTLFLEMNAGPQPSCSLVTPMHSCLSASPTAVPVSA